MSDKNQNFDDFDGADVPTYHGDKNSPLASDAPTTIFRPAASSGVSDYDPSAMPAHPSAHTPRGYADPPSYEEQPTVALSFSQSDRAAAAAGTDPNAYAPTEVAPPVEPTAPVDLSGDPYALQRIRILLRYIRQLTLQMAAKFRSRICQRNRWEMPVAEPWILVFS